MGSWVIWVVAGGVILALGAVAFVYFKYLASKDVVTKMMGLAGKLVEGVSAVLPDDAEKLDAHDIVLVVGRLLEEMPKWTADPANAKFTDLKDELVKFVADQRGTIPQLSGLPQETLEMVAKVLFEIAKALLPDSVNSKPE